MFDRIHRDVTISKLQAGRKRLRRIAPDFRSAGGSKSKVSVRLFPNSDGVEHRRQHVGQQYKGDGNRNNIFSVEIGILRKEKRGK
jgi:hypothetical protein